MRRLYTDIFRHGYRARPDIGTRINAVPWSIEALPDIDLPVFESVSLTNIRLTDVNGKIKFLLDRLVLDDVQDAGPVNLTGTGSVNGNLFQIGGRLGALQDIYDRHKPYPLDIEFNFADLILQVKGKIADYDDGQGLNLQTAADGLDLAKLLKLFQVDFPSPGKMNLKAAIPGRLGCVLRNIIAAVESADRR
ncbi:hypothetical protein D1AOALGA4SA_2764 [Olavius algarvensis Delta 1 endosymbiont]|nr:hypothetical protein D1AOALGA4SA_2764 [Olavius algarvensis Delta 1 endosymbiont]